jgi:hypothetical protein
VTTGHQDHVSANLIAPEVPEHVGSVHRTVCWIDWRPAPARRLSNELDDVQAADATPGRGDCWILRFNHAPSPKTLSKNGLPQKGGSRSAEGDFAKKNLRAGEDSAAALFSGRHDDALTIIHDHEAFSDGDCACRFRRIIVGCWLQLRANVTGACQFLQVAAGMCSRRDSIARWIGADDVLDAVAGGVRNGGACARLSQSCTTKLLLFEPSFRQKRLIDIGHRAGI